MAWDIMREEDLEIAIKVVIVGNGAVGKSSLIQRYCKGIFTKDYKKTIGVDFMERQVRLHGEEVRLMLWDTAGQEEFDAITKAYYRGAHAAVLTFSTTDRYSFEAVRSWKRKVEEECGEIPMVIVQNKIDLMDQASVEMDEVEAMARSLHCRLYRTSVKDDLNVNQVFQYLAEKYLTQLDAMMAEENELPPKNIMINDLASTQNNKKKQSQNSFSPYKSRTLGKIFRDTIKIQPTTTKKLSKNVKNASCTIL